MKSTSVIPLNDKMLKITFENNEIKMFDCKPYLKNCLNELKDEVYFNKVVLAVGGIEWPNGQDFSDDTLYLNSFSTNELEKITY
jgi:hypothetical protein